MAVVAELVELVELVDRLSLLLLLLLLVRRRLRMVIVARRYRTYGKRVSLVRVRMG